MKNTQHSLKLISGIIIGLIIGSTTVVGANQVIQAIQNDKIKISLNGIVQSFTDEITGETQYPITYNDRTYLPLRNVAQLSGLDVDYDNATNTARLTSNEKYLGDNYEGKYFWDYSLLDEEKWNLMLDYSEDSEILMKESTINNLASSIIKKYCGKDFDPSSVASHLSHGGDSAGGYIAESNYKVTKGNSIKYINPIEYKVAAVHNSTDKMLNLAIERKRLICL